MSRLIQFRKDLQAAAAEQGVPKLTFMPFCIKAASIALSRYPIVNSSLDLANESIIFKGSHNISVAIDTPQGLVVPNIKNCQAKNIIQIAKDLNALVERGRTGSLGPSDFADGTFSLSNIGIVSYSLNILPLLFFILSLSLFLSFVGWWHLHASVYHGTSGGHRRHGTHQGSAALQ